MSLVISLVIIVAAVYVLSVVTEDFFAVSLDEIALKLNMPSSVAGASLMAMGSSAPELCIALIALFQGGGEHSDVGIGTIVGSAVFNILIITGASAIARPARARLSVVLRDAVVYVLAIGALLLAIYDGHVVWWETLILLGLYAGYLVLLLRWKQEELDDDSVTLETQDVIAGPVDDHRPPLLLRVVPGAIRLLTGDPVKHYLWTFVLSIAIIGVVCWFLVDAAVSFASILGIPPVVVGLTVLAGATSVPDMISSMVASRKGRGEMAIANAIGSNIFDILIGLGVPWLVAIAALNQAVDIGVDGLWTSTLILLATVFLLVGMMSFGRVLSRANGYILVATYIGYAVWVWLTGGR